MKWYKVKAKRNFIWSNGVEKFIVIQGEILEIDSEAKKQLVNEEKLCELIEGIEKWLKKKSSSDQLHL